MLPVSFSTGQGNTRKPEWAQDANEEKPWNSNDGFDDGRWNPDKYDDGQWKPNGNQRPDENGKYISTICSKIKTLYEIAPEFLSKKNPNLLHTFFVMLHSGSNKSVFENKQNRFKQNLQTFEHEF